MTKRNVVSFRLTDGEIETLRERAKEAGVSPNAHACQLLMEALEAPKPERKSALAAITGDLRYVRTGIEIMFEQTGKTNMLEARLARDGDPKASPPESIPPTSKHQNGDTNGHPAGASRSLNGTHTRPLNRSADGRNGSLFKHSSTRSNGA